MIGRLTPEGAYLLPISFKFEDNYYNYYEAQTFLSNNWKCEVGTIGRNKIIDLGASFDIETYKHGDYTTMYVWQMAIGDSTIIGRTWEEFKETVKKLISILDLSEERKLICWIHNESYEWSFIKKLFQWDKVFAIEKRKVVTALYQGIEFRDSYILTNRKLELLAKDYKVGIEKLTEVYNYQLPMSSRTPLKICQLAYCINDVQILRRFFEVYVKKEFLSAGKKIPLTSTGVVREELKRRFRKQPKRDKEKWKRKIYRGYPKENEYKLVMRWLYRGGYVHANSIYSGELISLENGGEPTGSQDFKSSYPAVMLHNKYPFRFVKRDKSFFYKIKNNRKWLEENAFYGTFTFYKIRTKTSHTLESKHKVVTGSDIRLDNGRVSSARKLTVCLTEQDWLLYQLFYSWDLCICEGLRVASKEHLPDWFKDLILEFFYKKETLSKESVQYMLAKMQLNALYGMCCTGLYDTELIWENECGEFREENKGKTYEDLIKNQILSPWIGIWITAYARYNICSIMMKLGSYSAYYGDTDSIKYRGIIQNDYVFQDYNNRIRRMNKTMYVGDYDRKVFEKIGMFDYEGKSFRFMANGCKRYIHDDIYFNKKTGKYGLKQVVTIAGLPKGKLQDKAHKEEADIYSLFVDDMTLSEIDSGKLTSKYIDEAFTITYKDYQGREVTQSEESCVTLVPISFNMSITEDYLKYRAMEKARNQYIIGRRKI